MGSFHPSLEIRAMITPFTIETTYRLPVYRQRTYRAETLEQACRLAIEDDDWDDGKFDAETSGETYVTGIWRGADAAYRGVVQKVPSHFREDVERRSEQFDALVAVLAEVAQPMGLSHHDFLDWLPRAQAAVAKAEAIQQGARDPD
jgi:hypothetical protein